MLVSPPRDSRGGFSVVGPNMAELFQNLETILDKFSHY